MLSHGLYDPRTNAGGYNFHAGSCYSMYPDPRGRAIQSIGQKVFREGIDDMRALQTLEALKGREACDALIRKSFGRMDFHMRVRSPEELLRFRKEVNLALKAKNRAAVQ